MKFVKCVLYLALLSFSSFLFGRILPQRLRYDAFPFKSFAIEKHGAIYHKIAIRRWKNKLPDMSVLFYRWMPSKAIMSNLKKGQLLLMIQETCVAELIHILLCVFGFACISIWEGMGGWTVSVLYCIGNVPFCLVQRYNRPKLIKLLERLQAKGVYVEGNCYGGSDLELQYEARV